MVFDTALLGDFQNILVLWFTTSREHLGRLLASAMLNGYFLRRAEPGGW